jgi:hypothetical protein
MIGYNQRKVVIKNIKVDRYVSDQNSCGFKWLFGLSWNRYDEYEKYWMSLSTPQTCLEIQVLSIYNVKLKGLIVTVFVGINSDS